MISTSIAPWLSVNNSVRAVEFYKAAFGAIEAYRLDIPDGTVVAQLTVDGAAFWVSEDSPGNDNSNSPSVAAAIRMILTVSDPDALFARVLKAGASEVYPVSEEHGWRLGRLADPFGHHWEIGYPLAEN